MFLRQHKFKMRYCVYCDRNDVTSRDVSFHSFPKDDDIVIVWLTNMGVNIKWRPLKSHFLCSKHFASDCMIGNRLRKGSIPTLFEKNDKVNNKEIEINCQEIKVKKVYLREYNVNKNIKKKKVEEPTSHINTEINERNQRFEVKKEVDIDDVFKINVECSIKREADEEVDEIIKIKKEQIDDVEEGIPIIIKEEKISDDEPNDGVKAIMQRNKICIIESSENLLTTNDQPIEYPEIPIKQEILIQDMERKNDVRENSTLMDTEPLKNIIICYICYKYFHCKKTFEEHINEKHTERVSFNCSKCSFKTYLKYSLERHISSKHSSTSSFNCMYCSFKTYIKDSLDRHITWRHIKPTFNCDHCNYVTQHKGNLRKHINTKHTKSITFNCFICDYISYTKGTLDKHIKAKHTPTTHLDSHKIAHTASIAHATRVH